MSVPVELSSLYERIDEFGPVAYLVTVAASGLPHVVSVRVRPEHSGLVTGAGRKTKENVVAHPAVSLLWAAPPGSGYALIVDGTAVPRAPGEADEDGQLTLLVTPTAAVLHRTPAGDPTSPSCVKVLAELSGIAPDRPEFPHVIGVI